MKFLVVLRELDVANEDAAGYVVAVDAVGAGAGAGVGEVVMYAQGSSARQTDPHSTNKSLRRRCGGNSRRVGGRRRNQVPEVIRLAE